MSALSPIHVGLILGLLALVGGALWLLGAMQRQETMRARFETVLEGHRAARAPKDDLPLLRDIIITSVWFARLVTLMGIRRDRVNEYRPRWYVLLAAALVIARIIAGIAADALADALMLPVLLVSFVLASRFLFGMLERKRREKLFDQFPDALGQITRSVRVGMPVVEAVRFVATEAPEPTAMEFRAVADRLAVGVALDEALAEIAPRTGLPEYGFFATALSLQSRTGGGIAETLDNLADVIRKRVALRQRAIALSAEAKTSAAILASLPVLTGLALMAVTPSYAMVLFTTESGKMAMALATGMMLSGIMVMRFIIKKSLS